MLQVVLLLLLPHDSPKHDRPGRLYLWIPVRNICIRYLYFHAHHPSTMEALTCHEQGH